MENSGNGTVLPLPSLPVALELCLKMKQHIAT